MNSTFCISYTHQINQYISATRDTYSVTGNLNTNSTEIETAIVSLTGNNESYTSTVNSEGNYSFDNHKIIINSNYNMLEVNLHTIDEKPDLLRIYFPKKCGNKI